MTERLDSNTVLEGIDDEGSIILLFNLIYIAILVNTVSPI